MNVFVLSPRVVFRARVAAPLSTYPTFFINYDNLTLGSAAEVKVGMTVRFGSAPGKDDYGRQHISEPGHVGSPTSGSIHYGISSKGNHDGEIDLVLGSYIEVLDDYRVWAKTPYIYIDGGGNTVILKDGFAGAIGNVEVPPPVANGGPGFAATIDKVTGKIVHTFDGSGSWQLEHLDVVSTGYAGVSSYSWNIADGTLVSGTLTSGTLRASFPAGFRYVTLTVTGNTGKSHTCHVPVFARDPANDACVPHQITSHRITPEGQEMSVRLFEPLDRDLYPDGSLVMVWEDTDDATPGADHSHMVFVGWHQTDQSDVQSEPTATIRNSVLNCVDVMGRLKLLPGFTQIVSNVDVKVTVVAPGGPLGQPFVTVQPLSAPIPYPTTLDFGGGKVISIATTMPVGTSSIQTTGIPVALVAGDSTIYFGTPKEWLYTKYNTLLYYFWYLLYWHSTALEVADLVMPTAFLGALPFWTLSSDENNLAAQVSEIAGLMTPDHLFVCNRKGQLNLVMDAQLTPADDRLSGGTYLSYNDCLSFSFSDERPPTVARLVTWAVLANDYTANAVKCQAPGFAVGQGAGTIELTRRYVDFQSRLNQVEGLRYARANRRHGPVRIVIPYELLGGLEPAHMDWLLFGVGGTPRSFFPLPGSLTTELYIRGLVNEISLSYDYQPGGLVATATLTFEEEIDGDSPPAVTMALAPGASFFV